MVVFFNMYFFYVCMGAHVLRHTCVDSLQTLVVSFDHIDLRDPTQVVTPGCEHLYLLNHLFLLSGILWIDPVL